MQNSSEANIYSNIQYSVLFNIRIPRIILGCLVGMALGVSGAILQSLFRNPLVDPGFIGVSSGAAIGAMLVIMFSNLIKNFVLDIFLPYLLPIFAMIGAMTTTLLVYKISKSAHKTNVMVMLLAGIAINSLVGSIIGLLIISSNDLQLRAFTFWTLGGLDGANWQVIFIASTFILIPLVFIYFLRTKLDIFMLGDSEANNLGLNVEKFKKIIIFLSALMVGVSVSFCGMIGFIGLVTPHLIRLFIGPKHNNLLIGSSLLGALLLVFSDFIAKIIIAPAQLPISIITSLIGAPFFIWLIIEQKKRMKIA
tara:strand:+ start:3423 stop:4346 length:924 start_codon:yes stop_codon:yes gene_type:complete